MKPSERRLCVGPGCIFTLYVDIDLMVGASLVGEMSVINPEDGFVSAT